MNIIVRLMLISVFLITASATAQAQWPLGKDLTQPETKSSESGPYVTATGRFQIFVSPQAKGYTFMLDTNTGQIWIMKKDSTSGDFSLKRIPVDQVDAQSTDKSETKQKNGDKSSATKK